jgi:short-subunit dehydrogenase
MNTVVITGSTRGIGYAMAREFLRAGCNVTLSGRGETLAPAMQADLREFADRCIYIRCDVREKSDLQNLWDAAVQKWGQVDIWINNAGQNQPYSFSYLTSEHHAKNIVATNLTGMIYGSQVAAQGMLAQKHGAIYSMEGLGSNNMIQPKTILYGTTKHALTYYMKGLARELAGTGVIAGRLSPGMMLTDFITKTPDGEPAVHMRNEDFKKIFNILADRPETVAAFLVPRILTNTRNNAQIKWLTSAKAMARFMMAPLHKRKMLD